MSLFPSVCLYICLFVCLSSSPCFWISSFLYPPLYVFLHLSPLSKVSFRKVAEVEEEEKEETQQQWRAPLAGGPTAAW